MIFVTANTFAAAQHWVGEHIRQGNIKDSREARVVVTANGFRGLTIYDDDVLVDLRVAGPGQTFNEQVSESLQMALIYGAGRLRPPKTSPDPR